MLGDLCVGVETGEECPTAGDHLAVPDGVVERDGARGEDGATGLSCRELVFERRPVGDAFAICRMSKRNANSVEGVSGKSDAIHSSPTFRVTHTRAIRISKIFSEPVIHVLQRGFNDELPCGATDFTELGLTGSTS
jgi:hypothetical protein